MSVLWSCCDSWRSTQPPCTRFCIEWATNAAHSVMAGYEIVLELEERSWLLCFTLAAEPECCWLEHRTTLSYSSPVWSVWDCKPVLPQVPWTVDGVYGGWPENDNCTIVLPPLCFRNIWRQSSTTPRAFVSLATDRWTPATDMDVTAERRAAVRSVVSAWLRCKGTTSCSDMKRSVELGDRLNSVFTSD